jgi:hypothetical protein
VIPANGINIVVPAQFMLYFWRFGRAHAAALQPDLLIGADITYDPTLVSFVFVFCASTWSPNSESLLIPVH